MKTVGGVETFGPASSPQKLQKEGSTQGCAYNITEKDRPWDPEWFPMFPVCSIAQKCF